MQRLYIHVLEGRGVGEGSVQRGSVLGRGE